MTLADEYVFIDEWDVDAPQEAVFDALADARTYPEWWRPVYIAVEADCPPQVGCVSRQEFKGRLPYHLKTRSAPASRADRIGQAIIGRPQIGCRTFGTDERIRVPSPAAMIRTVGPLTCGIVERRGR